jgi:MFS family permease
MPYLILYYTVSLKMDNYVFIMAPAIILAAVFTAFWGRVYDKVKFKKSVFPALALLILGYVILYFFRGTALVFIGSLLMMCGYLAGAAVFGAVIRDNTPENRAGMFQGLRIFGQVLLPGIIGPAIGAKILENAEKIVGDDGTESFVPNANIFLAALIVALVLCVLLAAVFKASERKENK